jgi:hypothetical protein
MVSPQLGLSFIRRNDLTVVSILIIGMLVVGFALKGVPPTNGQGTQAGTNGGQGGPGGGGGGPEKKELVSKQGHTDEGASSDESFTIEDKGAIKIQATLQWTDDIGSNDEFSLTLKNATGEMGTDSGTSGSLTVNYDVEPGTDPMGDYTVTIVAVNCPGLVGASPIDRDTGNDWTLTVSIMVQPASGDGG